MAVIVNQTSFEFLPLPGRLDYPRHSLTVVAKATFELRPDQAATLADEQQPIGADIYDGDAATGSLRYESDLAHFKPHADLLLLATAYAPGGRSVPRCKVTFGVGGTRRTLYVTGDRNWTSSLLQRGVTEPEPFTSMPLDWAHAFGGAGVPENPQGKGYRSGRPRGDRDPHPLPNIEHPDDVTASQSHRPAPAGFAPISRMWQPRVARMGSYDEKWSNTRSPWFPADMKWTVNQAASPNLRMKGYLRGDEEIYLENLHPEFERFSSRLPGVAPRCFIHEWPEGADRNPARTDSAAWLDAWDRGPFRELELELDTLWLEADSGKLILVWRGNVEVASDEYEEIQHLYVTAEPLDARSSVEQARRDLLRELRESCGLDAESPAELEPEEPGAAAPPPPKKPDPAIAKAEAALKASLAAIPLGAGTLMATDDGILQARGEKPPATPEIEEPASVVEARAVTVFAALGVDIEEPQDEATPAEPELDDDEEDDPEFAGPWTRERVRLRLRSKGSLAEQDLHGLDLSRLDFSGIDLERARLCGANLRQSSFRGARLNGADLSEAKLRAAIFSSAEARDACFAYAKLNYGQLDSIVADRADFTGAELRRASLRGARLRQAYLTDCNLSEADLEEADLFEAGLTGAFGEAVRMSRADLTRCDASGSKFAKGVFRELVAPGSIWEAAELDEANFSYADLKEANLCKASLQGGDVRAADLRRANLRKVGLQGARLLRVNLFEAILEYADLRDADLSGSNLYGAEFADARLEGIRLEQANLRKTKLQELRPPR